MANHDYDPVIAEAGRRSDRAKASLRARLATLEHRIGDVRDRFDIPEQIRRHPLPAVGIALAFGALAGFGSSRRASHVAGRSFGATAVAALGALGLRIVREIAISQLSRAARQWIDPSAVGEADDLRHDATLHG